MHDSGDHVTAPAFDRTDLGAFLLEAREARGLSIRKLASLSGVDQATIGRIESGYITQPTAGTLQRLGEALRIPAGELYAKADYLSGNDLPTFRPYMRSKYQALPEEEVRRIEAYAARIAKRYGVSIDGPAPGEDESPPAAKRARKK